MWAIRGWILLLSLWLREVVGWIMIAAGLYVFYTCFALLLTTPPRFIQVIPLTFVGFIVMRVGTHMLRVSAAGLICLKAQREIDEATPATSGKKQPLPTRVLLHTPFLLGNRQR